MTTPVDIAFGINQSDLDRPLKKSQRFRMIADRAKYLEKHWLEFEALPLERQKEINAITMRGKELIAEMILREMIAKAKG